MMPEHGNSGSRKLILYIAASLDGYIAMPGEDLGFLSLVEKPGEDYGYQEFYAGIDTVIMGRKTWDWILKHAENIYQGKKIIILSHSPKPARDNISFYKGSLKELLKQLKAASGGNIFCVGGAEIVNQLMNDHLIDEYIISWIPFMAGNGTRLFHDGRPEERLLLLETKSYDTGLVQLRYRPF